MTYRFALDKCRESLRSVGIADDATDAWLLMEAVTGLDRAHYLLHMNEEMPGEEWQRFQKLYAKRMQRIPLQHILGEQEFMGLPFCVNGHVLIPRQDTETLVEEALRILNGYNVKGEASALEDIKIDNVCEENFSPKVLDLCTGSGCIIISLAHFAPQIAAYASDISEEALAVARENARANHVDVQFVQSDLFARVDGQFDLIVSNPPYIPTNDIFGLEPEVADCEPHLALDGGADGLDFYRRIVTQAPQHLTAGGWLLLEIGCDQAAAVTRMMEAAGFIDIKCIKDMAGRDRVMYGHL